MNTIKVTLYMDVFAGIDLDSVSAWSNPTTKPIGFKRYAIEVEIPDPNEPDETVVGSAKELV